MKKTFFITILSIALLGVFSVAYAEDDVHIDNPSQVHIDNPSQVHIENPSNIPIRLENPFKVGGNLFDLMKMIINDLIIPLGGIS